VRGKREAETQIERERWKNSTREGSVHEREGKDKRLRERERKKTQRKKRVKKRD
jgi:hypothetical protein